jgi:hypothetical protein
MNYQAVNKKGNHMLFESGQSGNPVGRPKGSYGGRVMALTSLDKLLAKKKNQKALLEALEQDLLKDPVRFFKTVIMPLLPRESKLSLDHDGVIQWRSLLGGDPVDGDFNPHPSQSEGVVSGQDDKE